METLFFKIEYATKGHTKFVKSNGNGCEIILITPLEKKRSSFKSPYPIAEENDYIFIEEHEYNKATEEIGIREINNELFIKNSLSSTRSLKTNIELTIDDCSKDSQIYKTGLKMISQCDILIETLTRLLYSYNVEA